MRHGKGLLTLIGAAFRQALHQTDAACTPPASRRRFLKHTAVAGIGAMLSCRYAPLIGRASQPSIAIVGAGIAGLYAAYLLQQAGYKATVYEAASRIGGRIFTLTDYFGKGLTTELGAEFIDSSHQEVIALAKELGIELYDTFAASEQHLTARGAFIGGKFRSEAEIATALVPFLPTILKDIAQLSEHITYKNASEHDKRLDHLSIKAYLEQIGLTDWLLELFDVAYTSEMSVAAAEQSALNLLTFLLNAHLHFGESDERYKVKGGTTQLITRLAARLTQPIELGHTLIAIIPDGIDQAQLIFNDGKHTVVADKVIITLPFPVLRRVDMARLSIPSAKQLAIDTLTLGSGTKLIYGAQHRAWRQFGSSGYTIHSQLQTAWDSSHMQSNNEGAGSFTVLLGGKEGATATAADLTTYRPAVENLFKTATPWLNDLSTLYNWSQSPYSYGSYTTYRVGQWTTLRGTETLPVRNILFAGEHCSLQYQGFMNGALETAALAVQQLLGSLKQ